MPDSALFAQPERRSFALPGLLALAALALAIATAVHFFPATTIDIEHLQTEAVPTETVFKGSSVIGLEERNHILFIASRIRVDNRLRVPIYLDDFHLTFTNSEDATLDAIATQKSDLPDLAINYPALKPLLTQPLLRNTVIDPGKSADGTVVFPLRIPKAMWDQRKSAILQVNIYHQHPVYITIPK